MPILNYRGTVICRTVSLLIVAIFTAASICPPPLSFAQTQPNTVLDLPVPGTMVQTTARYNPAIIRGLTINSDNPLQFDFIIDTGDDDLQGDQLQAESTKLIKYFLTSLTVSEENMWVNLSPYEKDRIIADGFGRTEMGRDLLAQDYLLKQLTASMIYPEDDLGKEFWGRVYRRSQKEFGTTEIPVNTYNKIWIVPDKANVYVNEQNVFVVESHLRVMLEEDYLALKHHTAEKPGDNDVITGVASDTIREILIPEIEYEVNNGRTFANLRQIYHSMILAAWYKKNLKESFLNKVYINKEKTVGVENADEQINQKIYSQYVTAFKEGVYSYIKEEYDPGLDEVIPRKYFSGGVDGSKVSNELGEVGKDKLTDQRRSSGRTVRVMAGLQSKDLSFRQSEVFSDDARFSLKQTNRLGEQQTLLEATLADFITPDGAVRGNLGVNLTPQVVEVFRQAVNSARVQNNSVEALSALTPLVLQLSKYSLVIKSDARVRSRFGAINNQIKEIPSSDQSRRQMINEILEEFNALSDEIVEQILQQSLDHLANHLQLSRSQFTDWDGVRIDLQLNAQDTFNIRAPREGELAGAVLEVDTLKMLHGYVHENTRFSWVTNQYNLLVAQNVQQLLESGTATDFVRNNADLVREVARTLLYMKKGLDGFNIIGASSTEDDNAAKKRDESLFNQRIEQLNAEKGNGEYVSLFQQLRNLRITEHKKSGLTIVEGDINARVAAAIEFILSKPALRRRAGVVGDIEAQDIAQIEGIIQASDTLLYNLKMVQSQQTVPTDVQSPQETVPLTQRPSAEILVNGTTAEYLGLITAATQSMRGIARGRERAAVFLTDVWPQFVSANESDMVDDSVANATLNAVSLLGDSELHDIYSRLIKASSNVERNNNKIQDIAGELRRNRFLRSSGIYVQVEVKSQARRSERGGIEKVAVLASESYVIDRVDLDPEFSDGQGKPVEVIYLGERLDYGSTGTTMRGFNWAGDTFGVVVKANIVDNARNNIIWYLFDENTDAVELDRLEEGLREAYRKDYPSNPTDEEVEAILKSRYEATAIHERQHIRDGIRNVQRHFSGRGMRIAQETTAYISSIAFSDSPFTELVKVLNLYMYSQQGKGALADYFHGGVHSQATERVLNRFANRLNVQGFDLDVNAMRESNAKLLEAALSLSKEQLKVLAQDILGNVVQAQLAGRTYGSTVVYNRLINQAGDQGRTIGVSIAKAAAKIFGGTYTVKQDLDTTTAVNTIDFAESVQVVSQVGLPTAVREAALFQRAKTAAPYKIGLAELRMRSQLESEAGDVYTARTDENILSVEDANGVIVSVGSGLSEVAKMYFDDFTMNAEIHSPNQADYTLEPVSELEDLSRKRGFYFVPAGTSLNVPYGLTVTYEVQPEDNLMSIARDFYGLNARGETKDVIEFDGVKDRWLWERITLANGLSSTAEVTAGQKLIIPTNIVEYGVNVLKRGVVSSAKPLVSSQVDYAQLGSSEANFTKGGIDFNPNNLELESTGDTIQMAVPDQFNDLQNITIDGFVPVIINIVPVNNLPFIMGGVDLEDDTDALIDSAQTDLPEPSLSNSELLTRLR